MGKSRYIIIIAAAILLEAISGMQYYYSHRLLEEELEKRAEQNLLTKAIIIVSSQKRHESALQNYSREVTQYIEHPDSMFGVMEWLVRLNPNILGGAIAFAPDYYPEKGRLFEPYAYRNGDKIERRQIGENGHDYTTVEAFRKPFEENEPYWSEAYYDSATTKKHLITYGMPVHDKQDKVVGVIGIDIDTEWMGDSLNRRQIYPSSFDMVLSRDGRLIAGPRRDAVSQRTVDHVISIINDSTREKRTSNSGHHTINIAEFTDPDNGDKGYVFYAPVKGKLRWQVAVVCYDDEVYGKLRNMRLTMLLMMLAGFALLGIIIAHYVRSNRRLDIAKAEKDRIDSELQIAKNIQMSMVPGARYEVRGARCEDSSRKDIAICGELIPAREVGGDLFDYFVRDEKLFFCIGDVSGKGIPAAMLMAVVDALFRMATAHDSHPARIMQHINETACQRNKSNIFITMFIGVLDLPTGRLRYCNAGHDIPVIMGEGYEQLDVKANLPVGLFDDFRYEEQETQLSEHATIFLYTDGLTEAMNTERKQFGMERMAESLQACGQTDPEAVVKTMTDRVHQFTEGAEQSDDLTMLAIRYCQQTDTELLDEQLVLKNDVREVARLTAFVKAVAEKLKLAPNVAKNVRLAVEEAVVNVIDYAYPAGTEGTITIEAKANGQRLKFIVSDTGAAFDPTEALTADTTLSVEERPIGGLGILLVRELMDTINYERIDGRNVLALTLALALKNKEQRIKNKE